MNIIYKSRANGEFAVVYYIYAHWLLNEGNSSKGGSMEPTEPPLDLPLLHVNIVDLYRPQLQYQFLADCL